MSGFPRVTAEQVPWLTVEEIRDVDRVMVEELGISLLQMMENAGRATASVARRLLGGDLSGGQVLVLAGSGGNGGGALAAARHLAVAGAAVTVHVTGPENRLTPATATQLAILRCFGLPVTVGDALLPDHGKDLVVDGLLGYSQRGAPRGIQARLIEQTAGRRVLSIDVPSGAELATGVRHQPAVSAESTVTLAMPKAGLRSVAVRPAVGSLLLADISVPDFVYRNLGYDVDSLFGRGDIVEIYLDD